MIIDFHTHIFPDDVKYNRENYFDDPAFRMLYSAEKSRLAGVDDLIDYINRNDMRGAVAMSFPWYDEALCRAHNAYMVESARRSHGKLFPFGMVPYGDINSVRKIAEEIKISGLYGIGEIAFYDKGFDSDNENFLRAVFEAATDLNLPVCLHLNEPVGHNYSGKYEPSLAPVYRLLAEYNRCRVILSHWGGGMLFYELMPEVKEALRNVWYDTAATPYIYSSSIYSTALGIIPAHKILFGSDFPLLGIKRYKENIANEADKSAPLILGLNAQSFLQID